MSVRVWGLVARSRLAGILRALVWTVGAAAKVAFALLAVATPLFVIWVASSLTAYAGGRVGLAAAVGLFVFPGVPLLWELVGQLRRRFSAAPRPAVLTWFDRFVLRSLVVGLGFATIVLVRDSATVFTALSTRGDWMLDGRDGPTADRMRAGLVRAAQTLEWLHEATHRNDYAELVDAGATTTTSEVRPIEEELEDVLARMRERAPVETTEAPGRFVARTDGWPFVAELHPAVLAIPADVETSAEAVGKHLAAVEPDPTLRVKAVHDYVADRIAYDVASYRAGDYPDQSAAAVLASRRGVCAGYANLVQAIGEAAGLEVVVVVGDARSSSDDLSGEGHAWNAARVGEDWVLLDATWDAGKVGDDFRKEYSTAYLMAPPAAFGLTHLPEEPRWQLKSQPLTRAEFLRQPTLRPDFYARGLRLRSPETPAVRVSDELGIVVDNPLRLPLMADIAEAGAPINFGFCEGEGPMTCRFDRPGTFDVRLWAEDTYVGQIRVHAAP